MAKNLPSMQETQETGIRSLDPEEPLEKAMATYSSILAWKIPWMEESGGLQSMQYQRVGHNQVTSVSLSLYFDPRGGCWKTFIKLRWIALLYFLKILNSSTVSFFLTIFFEI